MASPEEVATAAAAAAAYSSTDGGECQYAAATTTQTSITKRKRTKRGLRSLISSTPRPAPAPEEEEEEEYFSTSTTTTEEEEDMAHCLILLAQGHTAAASSSPVLVVDPGLQSTGDTIIRRYGGTTTAMGGALYVYECKTCNKCFPSFQALGGHRTSHKKPKLLLQPPLPAVKDDVVDIDREHGGLDITMNSSSSFALVKQDLSTTPPPAPALAPAPAPANKLSRVHECSICGSEFASGQALGGHMRRHRPVLGGAAATTAAPDSPEAPNSSNGGGSKKEEEKKCMLLSLDLNLPAPSEEINGAANSMADAFAFVDHRPLALVDCYY